MLSFISSSAHYVIKKFVFTHVHSHQDEEDTKVEDLPFPVQLNVLCNCMATAERKNSKQTMKPTLYRPPCDLGPLPLKSVMVGR
jgi:hypothetical protein